MGRRKSDKWTARLLLLALILTVVTSLFCAVIGYKAIRAVDKFYDPILDIGHAKDRALEPKEY